MTPNASSGTLSAITLTSLRAFFDSAGHRPGEEHWAALQQVAQTMEAMALGTCPAKIMLSSVDPGVGKTQTVAHFARTLVADAARRDVGMVICVGRLTEAKALADDLCLPAGSLAVLTSDAEVNARGSAVPSEAQILITTQQRIEAVCDGSSFATAKPFHYRGQPRQVRVWDEAWLPGVAVTLSRDGLFQLVKPLRPISGALAEAVADFAITLRSIEDGALVQVPDFGAGLGVSLADILVTAAGITGRFRDDEQRTATALVTMSGKVARACRDGSSGSTLLTYRDTLPADLAPLLVLDASGRVRETYRYVERHRGTLVRLKDAVKDYSPLTIRTWKTAGSKSGWQNNADELVQGVADAILSKPDERWLVVVHKAGAKVPDVERQVRRRLPTDTSAKVEMLTWGQHLATNLYADIPNVILAGTLFMAPSFYTSLTHLAQDRDVAPGLASPEEVAATMRGEHANLVLQALCRGRVRKSDGAKCLPMDAYVIATPRSGIPDDLARIFPGCRVEAWTPFGKKLTGKTLAAFETVQSSLAAGSDTLTYGAIAGSIGMDLKDFKKRIAKTDVWLDAMSGLGLEEGIVSGRAKGLRKAIATGFEQAEAA